MNIVALIGRWTRDPELKFTQNGKAIAKATIAVDRTFGEGTDFFNVTIWNKTAENTAQYTSKGSKIAIEGRIQQETWQDKETGKNRSKVGVVAERVEFLDNKQKNNEEYSGFQEIENDDIPF